MTAAYLDAAVVLGLVLEAGCGQLRRLWGRSTGRMSLEEVSEEARAAMRLMNPPESILIKGNK